MKLILICTILLCSFNSCEQTTPSRYVLKEDLNCKATDANDYYSDECTLNGVPYTGIAKEFHENGQLEAEYEYLYGKWNGTMKFYNEDGICTYIVTYENGVVQGYAYRYEDSGKLESTEIWSNGKKLSTIIP